MRRRLQAAAMRALPERVVEKVLRLDHVETVGEMCHWLAVRLSKMPWVDTLHGKTAGELCHILRQAGLQPSGNHNRRDLIARILREATPEGSHFRRLGLRAAGTLQGLLDKELPDDRQRMPASRAVGYIDECPGVVRVELGFAPGGAGDDPSVVRALTASLEALSPAAVRAMFRHFLPEAVVPSGTQAENVARMRRRLLKQVLHALPQFDAEKLLRLDWVNTVGEVCHWLAVRLSKMPWLGALHGKTAHDLRRILLEAGFQASDRTSHRALTARILRAATNEGRDGTSVRRRGTLRRLLELELSDGRQRMPASRAVGYIDECPMIVMVELGQAASMGRT